MNSIHISKLVLSSAKTEINSHCSTDLEEKSNSLNTDSSKLYTDFFKGKIQISTIDLNYFYYNGKCSLSPLFSSFSFMLGAH